MTERTIEDYLDDILSNLKHVAEFIKDLSFPEFEKDTRINYAVVRALEIIGESAKRIPDAVREKYPAIPWRAMAGMQDKLIHGYDNINLALVWATAKESVPAYVPLISIVKRDIAEAE
jgi:uncharacterized protein with HEPN domain